MGCVASKLEEEEEVVAICRERKRLLKLAVEKRYALAEAHCKYFHSLNAVAAAIKLFVARHSSPSSPFLITFPPPCPSSNSHSPPAENVIINPMFLQQTPSETKHEAIGCDSCISSTTSESSEEEGEEKREGEDEGKGEEAPHEQPCGYYCMPVTMPMSMSMSMPMPMAMPPAMPSPQRDFGWDFFYPFDSVRSDMCGYHRNLDDDLRAVREEEGIPELEEEVEREEVEHKVVCVEENNGKSNNEGVAEQVMSGVETVKVVDVATENQGEQRGLAVLDTPAEGRELLEALKDIEDHFLRAYDSGKDVTRMLEANRIPLQSSLDEIKGGFLLSYYFY